MPAPWNPPLPLPADDLAFQAKIDYLTLRNLKVGTRLPPLSGPVRVVRPSRNTFSERWVTVHDPDRNDIIALGSILHSTSVAVVEISVDLRPKAHADPVYARKLLEQTFLAVAARFRPEDQAYWDHISRGAVKSRGVRVESLERRLARLGEEVIYGGRYEWMQSKLYLKVMDQGVELPIEEHSVRMELTLRGDGLGLFRILRVQDLIGYPYRRMFTKHFRIIDHPELRAANMLGAAERERRTKRMIRAWSTAGVGKFAIADRPREDYLIPALKRKAARERAQLPAGEYKLIRDQKANAKIGAAFTTLERRMRA